MLGRSLYRGVLEYCKTRKRDQWGAKKTSARPEQDLIQTEMPHLRIVPEALATAVDALRAEPRICAA